MDDSWLTEKLNTKIKLNESLTTENYPIIFREALKIEYRAQKKQLEWYNKANCTLEKREKNIYAVFVENLMEKRPSVMIGDLIRLRNSQGKRDIS